MKTNIILLITSIILCTAFYSDYRDPYIGIYFCQCSRTSVNSQGFSNKEIDTVSVFVLKDEMDSVLNIKIQKNTYKFKLKSNTLYAYSNMGHYYGNFYSKDSLIIHLSYGHFSSMVFKGKKK